MRAQQFCTRSLRSKEPWNWLLTEFSEYYGVTDTYTRLRYLACDIIFVHQIWNVMSWIIPTPTKTDKSELNRYLSYVMDVATPTKDCLELIHELLVPVMKARSDRSMTRQEVSNSKLCNLQDRWCLS